jgi:hypothetical protein
VATLTRAWEHAGSLYPIKVYVNNAAVYGI